MMAEEKADASPATLATMLGAGDYFTASNGKQYKIEPLTLKEVQEIANDGISLGTQLANILEPKLKKATDKWLKRKVRDENSDPVTIDGLIKDKWTVVDLRNAIRKIADLSG